MIRQVAASLGTGLLRMFKSITGRRRLNENSAQLMSADETRQNNASLMTIYTITIHHPKRRRGSMIELASILLVNR